MLVVIKIEQKITEELWAVFAGIIFLATAPKILGSPLG